MKEKLSFFSSYVGTSQFFLSVYFFPESLLYYSHKTLHFWSPNMWRLFPHQPISVKPAGNSTIEFNSDAVYLELVSDPTGYGLCPTRLPPLQMPVTSPACYLCLRSTGCKLEAPMIRLFRFNQFARVVHRAQENCLLTRLPIYYKRT